MSEEVYRCLCVLCVRLHTSNKGDIASVIHDEPSEGPAYNWIVQQVHITLPGLGVLQEEATVDMGKIKKEECKSLCQYLFRSFCLKCLGEHFDQYFLEKS